MIEIVLQSIVFIYSNYIRSNEVQKQSSQYKITLNTPTSFSQGQNLSFFLLISHISLLFL